MTLARRSQLLILANPALVQRQDRDVNPFHVPTSHVEVELLGHSSNILKENAVQVVDV
jgi:hypothetical protein